ncbi:MAG: DUF2461 domain-containing protein [Microscillaceae bacterium]|nr:DUF2461 domain-containing protein [Microscillaceae bacterium]
MSRQIILNFLSGLQTNNNREWMEANKKTYQDAKTAFEELVHALIQKISAFDSDIADLEPKQCIFRLNRDIRFSKDKSPYKLNFGAAMQKGGKKSRAGGYYIHIQPNQESFVGGGIYMPDASELAKIRQEIDYNGESLKKIIQNEAFIQRFGEIWGEKVKSAPKGYAKDHPDIELLKLKSFVVFEKFNDPDILKDDFADRCVAAFQALKPLNDFLNEAIL